MTLMSENPVLALVVLLAYRRTTHLAHHAVLAETVVLSGSLVMNIVRRRHLKRSAARNAAATAATTAEVTLEAYLLLLIE